MKWKQTFLSIVTCGLMMKPYLDGNLSEKTKTTTKVFMKTMSNTWVAFFVSPKVGITGSWWLLHTLSTIQNLKLLFIGIFERIFDEFYSQVRSDCLPLPWSLHILEEPYLGFYLRFSNSISLCARPIRGWVNQWVYLCRLTYDSL